MAPHGPYPWDDLARCLWMLAEMETMVDSMLFRNGTGSRRADAVGIGLGDGPNVGGHRTIVPVCARPRNPVISKTHK
jgi:hypothetical protein